MLKANYFYSASWLLPLRIILSVLYAAVMFIRNKFYDLNIFKTFSVPTTVVSVGNLTTGGSGKTILVQSLLDFFIHHNLRPTVLSRGYKRSTKGLLLVSNGESLLESVTDSGDEPFLIAVNYPGVPVLVSEDRVLGARYLAEHFQPDMIILDDGFQHRRLNRDIDIVIFDQPENQFTHILPWGNLREEFGNMNRADIIIYSKSGLRKEDSNNLTISPPSFYYDYTSSKFPLENIKGNYGLFAGIANPEFFFQPIKDILGPPETTLVFPDHVHYGKAELDMISSSSCSCWITTQKDFIKFNTEFCHDNHIYHTKVSTPVPPALERLLKEHFKV